jgi:tRNA A37 threonylcarbamoyltransferase TsaD
MHIYTYTNICSYRHTHTHKYSKNAKENARTPKVHHTVSGGKSEIIKGEESTKLKRDDEMSTEDHIA